MIARRVLAALALAACGGGALPPPPPPGRAGTERSDDDEDGPADVAGHEGDEGDEGDEPKASPIAGASSLLDEAWRELRLVRETRYSHRTHVDEVAGRFEVDCSGFVGYALGRAVPDALDELRAATVRRPLARHFVEFFEALARGSASRRWQAVARATDLEPGDVIAWLRPADAKSSNTGHVMIVRAPGHRDAARGDLIAVPIIDAAAVTHGNSDSRKAARRTGIGTGEVLLIVDPAGAPIGYRWSRGSRAREHRTTIAIARIR